MEVLRRVFTSFKLYLMLEWKQNSWKIFFSEASGTRWEFFCGISKYTLAIQLKLFSFLKEAGSEKKTPNRQRSPKNFQNNQATYFIEAANDNLE